MYDGDVVRVGVRENENSVVIVGVFVDVNVIDRVADALTDGVFVTDGCDALTVGDTDGDAPPAVPELPFAVPLFVVSRSISQI